MDSYVEMMVRNRLSDLPLQDSKGKPKALPNDCIDYIVSIVGWAMSQALVSVGEDFNLDDEDIDEINRRINELGRK